jgi:hypothetical protein
VEALQVISVLFIAHWFLHTLYLYCNNEVKYCRLSSQLKGSNGRSCRQRWRPTKRGWRRCLPTCKVLAWLSAILCHLGYSRLHSLLQLLL